MVLWSSPTMDIEAMSWPFPPITGWPKCSHVFPTLNGHTSNLGYKNPRSYEFVWNSFSTSLLSFSVVNGHNLGVCNLFYIQKTSMVAKLYPITSLIYSTHYGCLYVVVLVVHSYIPSEFSIFPLYISPGHSIVPLSQLSFGGALRQFKNGWLQKLPLTGISQI